jgi:hypothetical protein
LPRDACRACHGWVAGIVGQAPDGSITAADVVVRFGIAITAMHKA